MDQNITTKQVRKIAEEIKKLVEDITLLVILQQLPHNQSLIFLSLLAQGKENEAFTFIENKLPNIEEIITKEVKKRLTTQNNIPESENTSISKEDLIKQYEKEIEDMTNQMTVLLKQAQERVDSKIYTDIKKSL